jgi:hypothetical protein
VTQFDIPTTAQVRRVYRVTANDEEQAQKRLRAFLKDPDSIREDLVSVDERKQTDTTPQQIVTKEIVKLKAPGEAVAQKDGEK